MSKVISHKKLKLRNYFKKLFMEKYKTVIIGVGPAGLRCAKVLAEHKENFLVLEKNDQIVRKICTGIWGITPKTDLMGLPNDVFEKKFSKVIFSTPHRVVEVIRKKPFVASLDRKKLDEWMLAEAKKAGANIIFGAAVSEIKENSIICGGRKIFFDNLVGADGSQSIVRKSLGLPEKLGIGIQYWIEKPHENMEIHFDVDKFGPWYSWLVPHEGKTCIGTGGDLHITSVEKLKKNLNLWCKERSYDIASAKFEGAFINYKYSGYKFNNRYLIGDAAGLPSGLTGEGIYFAMVSGEEVAKMVISKSYKPELIDKILNIKKKHEIIANIFRFNKTLTKVEHNILLSLFKLKFFSDMAINLIA